MPLSFVRHMPQKVLLLGILLSFCLLLVPSARACAVTKKQLWHCLLEHADKDNNNQLTNAEIRKLVHDNTHWYERLIKSPDSVVHQVEQHCGLPLAYSNLLKGSCFKHCGGLDGKRTIYNRICQ